MYIHHNLHNVLSLYGEALQNYARGQTQIAMYKCNKS